jgi:hypothetical protein
VLQKQKAAGAFHAPTDPICGPGVFTSPFDAWLYAAALAPVGTVEMVFRTWDAIW